MNHIFMSGEHLFVAFVDDGNYPIPEGFEGDTGVINLTNWPFDIMRINESNCMVFADPKLMSTMGAGFTSNGELIIGALVWRDQFVYRYLNTGELQEIGKFPSPWCNFSPEFYKDNYNSDVYDQLRAHLKRLDNLHDAQKYQDDVTAEFVHIFVRNNIAVRHCYSINVRTGMMSRQYRKRLEASRT